MKYTHKHKINKRNAYILSSREDIIIFLDDKGVMYLVPPTEVDNHWDVI